MKLSQLLAIMFSMLSYKIFPMRKQLFLALPLRANLCLVLVIATLLLSDPVRADSYCSESQLKNNNSNKPQDCVEENTFNFGLSVGIGLVSNPLNQSDNIPLVLLPSISFYSGDFFIENLEFGYMLNQSEQSSFAILASPSYDSIFFNRWDPGNVFVDLGGANAVDSPTIEGRPNDQLTVIAPDELSTRKFSYLAGVEYSRAWNDQQLQIAALSDITGVHSGSEIRFAYQHQLTETIKTTLGFTWKDKDLTNYYYGVTEQEIVDDRAAYQADSSLNPFGRISYTTQLEGNDSLRASLQYQKLDSQISQSPIVDNDYVVTFFVGRTFRF